MKKGQKVQTWQNKWTRQNVGNEVNVHLCFACANEQHVNTVYTSVWNRSVAHVCTEQDFYYTHLSGHLITCSTLITDSSFVHLSCTSWSQPIEHNQQRSNSLLACQSFLLHPYNPNTSSSKLKTTSRDVLGLFELESVVLTNCGCIHFTHLILWKERVK